MLAAIEGNRAVAELLLERGADVNSANNVGETALSLAAHNGHVSLVRLLKDSGAGRHSS